MGNLTARRACAAALAAGAVLLGCCTRRAEEPVAQPALASGPIRPEAVAGSFYPAQAPELRSTVEGLMARARKAQDASASLAGRRLVGLLVPHAGYVYSGLTAAHAFAAAEGRHYDAVLLLGSPHQMAVRGACVYTGAGFATPLGVVPVERELARSIASLGPLFNDDPAPHASEHSLEVELPFLQYALGEPAIVPILIMAERRELGSIATSLTQALRRYCVAGKSVLVVVSTDLAHYPTQKDAEESDAQMLEAVCALDGERLFATDAAIMSRHLDGMACTMCGLDAAYIGVEVMRGLGVTEARVMHAGTSADAGVSGADSSRVVGYGAVAFLGGAEGASGGEPAPDALARFEPLTRAEQEFLLALARRTIRDAISHGHLSEVEIPAEYSAHLEERRGVFVTLTMRGELRGCIGTHEPDQPLWRTVQQMALASAFGDPRFPQLTAAELDGVKIEVSVYLTGVHLLHSPQEYIVGRHGIILTVGDRSATFLPRVPVDQGWDRLRTLRELCRKAGLPEDAWQRADARFSVYETQVFAEADAEQ